jgi:hypothetical protein
MLSLSRESEKIRRRTYRTEICSSLLPILPHPLDAETDFTTSTGQNPDALRDRDLALWLDWAGLSGRKAADARAGYPFLAYKFD